MFLNYIFTTDDRNKQRNKKTKQHATADIKNQSQLSVVLDG